MGIYIDGLPHSSEITNSISNFEELKIGNFNGLLDELMLFNESLVSIQVSEVYNNQKK